MAFGKRRGDITGAGIASEPESAPGALTAFIDQGSSFEGKLSFKDTVRIDGHFSGEIASENTLVVGETGEIEANIRSRNVVVSGTVSGDIHAESRVVLHKTARIMGDVESPAVAIEEGAVVNGRLCMPDPDAAPRKAGRTSSTGPMASASGEAKEPSEEAKPA